MRFSRRVVIRAAPVGLALGLVVALVFRGATGSGRAPEVPLSQRGTVTQHIAGMEVRVVYARPVARGRELFGGIVPFAEVWNPGADRATRIELSGDLLVDGKRLQAGEYSIWMIPDPERWTVIFSRAWNVYHIPYPEGRDALRLTVVPVRAPHMETLAFYFPVVDQRRAVLSLHWGETRLDIPLEVPG